MVCFKSWERVGICVMGGSIPPASQKGCQKSEVEFKATAINWCRVRIQSFIFNFYCIFCFALLSKYCIR